MYDTNFLTGKQIAAILKISKALAYRLIAKGEIPSVRFGRTVRVKQEALDEFIQRSSSTQDEDHPPQFSDKAQKPSPQRKFKNG